MSRKKSLLGIVVALALAITQVSMAAAAPNAAPIEGTVDDITVDVNTSTVTVTYTDDTTLVQDTVDLTFDEAEALGLISVDNSTVPPTVEILVDPSTSDIGITIAEDGTVTVALPGEGEGEDACAPGTGEDTGEGEAAGEGEDAGEAGGGAHPVATALCDFFGGSQGLTYDQIMQWHEDGFGFGVIAQVLWMAEAQGWDAQAILDAKKGDFSGLEGLPEDVDNWGQLRQYAFGKGAEKVVHNLGEIMSGRATPLETPTATESPTVEPTLTSPTSITTLTTASGTTLQLHGKGKGGQHGKGGGKGKGHNK